MYYQKLMNRKVGMIFPLIIVLCLASNAFAFTDPPYIPVQKPTPTATKTVCASGCNYTTLEAADQAAQPGWLIKVKAGSYSGNMTWNSSGTPGNEIVIEAYGDGDVMFNVTSRFYMVCSYVIFDGGPSKQLLFDGTGQAANSQDNTISIRQGSSHITLSRIQSRNSTVGAPTSVTGTNIDMIGDYHKVYNCDIYGSMDEGIYIEDGDYVEIRNNLIHDNCGTGVQVNPHSGTYSWSSDELTIAGNMIYNNGGCKPDGNTRPGIGLLSNDNTLYDVYVYNNIIWNNKSEGIGVSHYTNINARIYNNTIYNNIDNGVDLEDAGTMSVENNIVYNNGGPNWEIGNGRVGPTGIGNGNDMSTNNLTSNPLFESTSPSSPDYLKLSSRSLGAIDTGVDLRSLINNDYYGNFRPTKNAYDIGAHEYTAGAQPNISPAVPQNLKKVLQ